MSPRLLAATLILASTSLFATPKIIRTCIDERPWIPYTHPDPRKPGTMQRAIRSIGKKLGIQIIDSPLPWRRCQAFVRSGAADAMVGGSYMDFNLEFSDFPMLGNAANSKKSLGFARVILLRRAGSAADFDGKSFLHTNLPVGTPAGTRIVLAEAQKFGPVDDDAHTDEQNIQKLLAKRIDLMAGYEFDLKELIKGKYEGKVEILARPLVASHYYLAFSKKFTAENRELVELIWKEIEASKRMGLKD